MLKRVMESIIKNKDIVNTSEIVTFLNEKDGEVFSNLFDKVVESGKATYTSDVNKDIAKEILKQLKR